MKQNFVLFEKAMTILFSLLVVVSMALTTASCSKDDPEPEPPKPDPVLVEGLNFVSATSKPVIAANALKLTRSDEVTANFKVVYDDKTSKDTTVMRTYASEVEITENSAVTYLEKGETLDPLAFAVTAKSETQKDDIVTRKKEYEIKLGAKAVLTAVSLADSSYVAAYGKTVGIVFKNEFVPKSVASLDDGEVVGTEEKDGVTYDKKKLNFVVVMESEEEILFSHTFAFPQEPTEPEIPELVLASETEFTGEYLPGIIDAGGASYTNTVLLRTQVNGELGFKNLTFNQSRIALSKMNTLSFDAFTGNEFGLHGDTINLVSFKNSKLTGSNVMRGELGTVEFDNSELVNYTIDEVGTLGTLKLVNTPTTNLKILYTTSIDEVYIENKVHKEFNFASSSAVKKLVIKGALIESAVISGEIDEVIVEGGSQLVSVNISGLQCKKFTIKDDSAIQNCRSDVATRIDELTYNGNPVDYKFFFPIQ